MKIDRIPSLDGARAVSIMLVIAWHIQASVSLPFIWRTDLGNIGVRTFFVISGFLITSLLLRERERTGRIGIREFCIRRAFRIWPAYYFFLAVMATLVAAGYLYGNLRQFVPAAFYFSNYKLPPLYLEHSWSLSVEEQFYLLWPLGLAALGNRKGIILSAIFLLVGPVFRFFFDIGLWHPIIKDFAFECVCDALAVGCLLALLRERLWSLAPYRRLIQSPLIWTIPVIAYSLWIVQPGTITQDMICIPILNVSTALLLDRYMRFPATAFGRVLNLAPVAWIGTISYSLYLWQQPLVDKTHPALWKLAVALCCAVASFYLIERPMLRIGRKLRRGGQAALAVA